MATAPPPDIVLTPLHGDSRPLEEWLTTFHLASIVLDPYTNESAWILPTAVRIMNDMRGCDARVNFILTASASESRLFLGPLANDFLVFVDPERALVRALGLQQLPAFVFLRFDGTVQASAEGWDPAEWRSVADVIATTTAWIRPALPVASDPGPFRGTPALV